MGKIRHLRLHIIHAIAIVVMTSAIAMAAENAATDEPPVAVVNGRAISKAELDALADASPLPREYVLRDLIDLILLKSAAKDLGVKLPAEPWDSETQAGIELAVAQGIGIEIAKARTDLVVDHAWLKDAKNAKKRAAGRASLEKLRALVAKGATIPAAFAQLKLDGRAWHIGDHEEYPYETIPAEARDLPPGGLSPIIPGDGGLHLFRVYEKKQSTGPRDVISSQLRDELRRRATIEQAQW